MNSKERVIAAINLKTPGRIPLDGSFRQDVWSKLEDHFGTKEAEDIMDELGIDIPTCMMETSERKDILERVSQW